MSAFVVEDKTINRIVSYLSTVAHSKDANPVRWVISEAGWDVSDLEPCRNLAREMHKLNVDAVNYRYPDQDMQKHLGTELPFTFKWEDGKYEDKAWTVQVYKHVKCFLYQCSEGEQFEQTELYKAFRKVEDALASHIIDRFVPEYDKAEWA